MADISDSRIEQDFIKNAKELVSISNKIGDGWKLQKHEVSDAYYVTKKESIKLKLEKKATDPKCPELETEHCEVEATDDTSTRLADIQSICNSHLCTFDYHILFSPSHQVPVLYLSVYRQDGSLVGLEDLWSSVPPLYQARLQQDRWTFLTQQEHPILRRPFYQLHPCKTGELLKQITSSPDQSSGGRQTNPLISWLSTVGPVVHLHLPLQYCMELHSNVLPNT